MAGVQVVLRQPRQHDLLGARFVIAGQIALEATTARWTLTDAAEVVLGQGEMEPPRVPALFSHFQLVGLVAGQEVRGAPATLQVLPGVTQSGTNLVELAAIQVVAFTELRGWRVHVVERGDTLSRIARAAGRGTTAGDIFAANRHLFMNPDVIQPGQELRVPLLA